MRRGAPVGRPRRGRRVAERERTRWFGATRRRGGDVERPGPFLEQWRDAVSGSTAGMVSVLALHPLDVIKTRLQGASPTLNRTDTSLHSAAARDPRSSTPNVRPNPPRLPLHSPRSHRQAAGDVQGTFHAFRTVLAREGVRGLYAGLSPALIGSTVSWGNATFRFTTTPSDGTADPSRLKRRRFRRTCTWRARRRLARW